MRRKVVLEFVMILVGVLLTTRMFAQEQVIFKSDREKLSYAIGVDLARNFQRQGIDAETDAMLKGMRDVLSRSKLLLNEQELWAVLNVFQTEMKQNRARAAGYVQQLNKTRSDTFLAANKTKEGVVALSSGLQYRILKEGDGRKPTEADTVEVNYRSTLIDGTEVENSYVKGEPIALQLAGAVKGLSEALQLMPMGSKWQVFIPPELAYGVAGYNYGKRVPGRAIGPNETLIVEIELLSIK